MTTLVGELAEITEAQFHQISRQVKELCGINLHVGKKELVKARLGKRLRVLGLCSYGEYIAHLQSDSTGDELTAMLDVISTNQTNFFREPDHFEYLANRILASKADNGKPRRLRIWSAGCSSGEEPYSIAITVREALPNVQLWDVRILATDLSTRMLKQARRGAYTREHLETVPPLLRSKHFTTIKTDTERLHRVSAALRGMVHFSRLNLMDAWPMRGPFDVIFCRNVMIYFEKSMQARLVGQFRDLLAPGGTLFIGHSESLTGVRHQFQYVQPTVYEKN